MFSSAIPTPPGRQRQANRTGPSEGQGQEHRPGARTCARANGCRAGKVAFRGRHVNAIMGSARQIAVFVAMLCSVFALALLPGQRARGVVVRVFSKPAGARVFYAPPGETLARPLGSAPLEFCAKLGEGQAGVLRLELSGHRAVERRLAGAGAHLVELHARLAPARPSPRPRLPALRTATLAAVGDVRLGTTREPFAAVADVLREADIAFANLECAITRHRQTTPAKSWEDVRAGREFVFRAPPQAAEQLAKAGIDVVSLANNHAMDFCAAGLLDTLHHLRAAGVAAVGAGANAAQARAPAIVERRGLRVAFLACSAIVPSSFAAGPRAPGIFPHARAVLRDDPLLEAVASAKRRADVVVVSLHWGVERQQKPTEYQRALAQACIAAGATVVLGHHPHCLQPVERIGRGVVVYSLGNFVGLGTDALTRRTMIFRCAVSAEGVAWAETVPCEIVGGRPRITGSASLLFRGESWVTARAAGEF